ncbi:hypothetical protein CYY_010414, partial [Polysphondylium violaceum]
MKSSLFILIFVFVFLSFNHTNAFTARYAKTLADYNSYASYSGFCQYTYNVFLDVSYAGMTYFPVQDVIVGNFLDNSTDSHSYFLLGFSKPPSDGVFNFQITIGSDTQTLDIPFNCKEFPTPIIRDIGFQTPFPLTSPYKFTIYIENKEANFGQMITEINATYWQVYGDFTGLKTYTFNFQNSHPSNETEYLEFKINFPGSGYVKTYNLVVPTNVTPQEITYIQSSPTTQVLTSKFSLSLDYKKTLDIPLFVNSEVGFTGSTFSPVYGNSSNATCKAVFDISQYETSPISFNVFSHQAQQPIDLGSSFSISLVYPSILSPTRTFNTAQQLTILGFASKVLQVEYQNQNLLYRSVAKVVQFSPNIAQRQVPYAPSYYLDDGSYGIVSGTSDNYKMQFNFVRSKYDLQSPQQLYFFNADYTNPTNIPTTGSAVSDNYFPLLTNIQVITMPSGFNRYFNVRFSAVDDLAGIRMLFFTSSNIDTTPIFTSSLIQGNYLDGTYEAIFDAPYYYSILFQVFDYASQNTPYGPQYYTTNEWTRSLIVTNPPEENILTGYCDDDFTSASWSHNDIDLSSSSYYTKLQFNLFNADKLFSPTLIFIGYDNLPLETFYGYWNETSEQYEIVVKVPARTFTGVVQYKIYLKCGLGYTYESTVLNSMYPSSELRVFSNDADMFGPELIDLSQLPGQVATVATGGGEIGWKFKVYDRLNGFEYGNITIVSDRDLAEYTFVLDPNIPSQEISIKINEKCLSQTYSIKNI